VADDIDDDTLDQARPFLMGKAAAVTNEKKPAKEIIDDMVSGAVSWLQTGNAMIKSTGRL